MYQYFLKSSRLRSMLSIPPLSITLIFKCVCERYLIFWVSPDIRSAAGLYVYLFMFQQLSKWCNMRYKRPACTVLYTVLILKSILCVIHRHQYKLESKLSVFLHNRKYFGIFKTFHSFNAFSFGPIKKLKVRTYQYFFVLFMFHGNFYMISQRCK